MTAFAVIAAIMCLAACLIVLRPLLWPAPDARPAFDAVAVREEHEMLRQRLQAGALSEADHQAARDALARRLLDALTAPVPAAAPPRAFGPAIIATVIFIPLVALPLYWATGTPIVLRDGIPAAGEADNQAVALEQMRERIKTLEERLAATPQDAKGWAMLGRSYAALGEYARAASAFAKADPLAPNDAQLLSDYADALAMAQGRKLDGVPMALLRRALAADPDNIKALLLAGTADFEAGQFVRAIERWERVVTLAPQDTELVGSLRKSIDEARAKAGGAAPAPVAREAAAAGGAEAVSGRISLGGDIAARAAPEDTVFVFARAAQGPRMPLAAFKLKVRDLPADFRLDDSMAMAPVARISGAAEVIVTARISKSGDPIPKPGDLEGNSSPVKPGTGGIKLEIREVVK